MPIDPQNYPADWPEISGRIRERDGHRCKFCGLPQHTRGWRDRQGNFFDVVLHPAPAGAKLITIRLTVAHLNQDTTDNRDENLAALCQQCHLRHDQKQHQKNAGETRRYKRRMSGQLELLK